MSYLVAYLTLSGGIYAAFNASESLLKRETKRRIGAWLGRPDDSKRIFDEEWTGSFVEFFDTLFVPKRRRGWRFPLPGFLRSAMYSSIFALLLFILFYVSSNKIRIEFINKDHFF